ncbi:quinone oxidoreductase-like protein 1 [Clavelina lepadiformis]|uniref:quinone oxidoreductase-like protein 1 n=1 Tax=Clavelina lepadiformis TaxID=159417 RepID=UPI0040413258
MLMDQSTDLITVTVAVKTCSIEKLYASLLKKFISPKYTDGIVVRDVAGVVTKVGAEVSRFRVGDEVIGLLSVDNFFDIKDSTCDLLEYQLVKKPKTLSWEIASCCIMDGLKAYDALHYLGRVQSGTTLLICNAVSSFGVLAIQLAREWGVKVFSTAENEEDAQTMRTMSLDVERILDGHQFVRNSMKDETGGIGVDCIIDSGVFPNVINAEDRDSTKPMKHDIISSLAINGKWVTSQHDLQLDPPDSEILHMKNASVCHLFPDAMLLSSYQQNKVLHIMDAVLEQADAGVLRPHFMSVLPASELIPSVFPTKHRIVLKL